MEWKRGYPEGARMGPDAAEAQDLRAQLAAAVEAKEKAERERDEAHSIWGGQIVELTRISCDLLKELESDRDRLAGEVAALREDAARFRSLADGPWPDDEVGLHEDFYQAWSEGGEALRKYFDARIAALSQTAQDAKVEAPNSEPKIESPRE